METSWTQIFLYITVEWMFNKGSIIVLIKFISKIPLSTKKSILNEICSFAYNQYYLYTKYLTSYIRHNDFCLPPPSSSIALRGPPQKYETGWTGKLWSEANLLNWQKKIYLLFRNFFYNPQLFWKKNKFFMNFFNFFQIFSQELGGLEIFGQIEYS